MPLASIQDMNIVVGLVQRICRACKHILTLTSIPLELESRCQNLQWFPEDIQETTNYTSDRNLSQLRFLIPHTLPQGCDLFTSSLSFFTSAGTTKVLDLCWKCHPIVPPIVPLTQCCAEKYI